MATLFVIAFILALFHFVYESIIAPMVRLELRYKLFKLRDSLRNFSLNQEGSRETHQTIELLDNSICTVIKRLPNIDLKSSLAAQKAFDQDDKFREAVLKRRLLLEDSPDEAIKNFHNKLMTYSSYALVCNMGGWAYILLPIFIAVTVFSKLSNSMQELKERFRNVASNFAFARDNDFNQFPNGLTAS